MFLCSLVNDNSLLMPHIGEKSIKNLLSFAKYGIYIIRRIASIERIAVK